MAAHQALPSLGFSRQEYWSGLPFPSPMHESEKWKVAQSCLTLRDPMDCSLPGSSAHGIFQARVLEWGAIAFSSRYIIFTSTRKEGHRFSFISILILSIFFLHLLTVVFLYCIAWSIRGAETFLRERKVRNMFVCIYISTKNRSWQALSERIYQNFLPKLFLAV